MVIPAVGGEVGGGGQLPGVALGGGDAAVGHDLVELLHDHPHPHEAPESPAAAGARVYAFADDATVVRPHPGPTPAPPRDGAVLGRPGGVVPVPSDPLAPVSAVPAAAGPCVPLVPAGL